MYSLAERRIRLRGYMDGWKDAESSVRYEYTVGSLVFAMTMAFNSPDVFSARLNDTTIISFIRIPSSPNQETVEEWTLEIPFRFERYAVYPQYDLLAVVEQVTG